MIELTEYRGWRIIQRRYGFDAINPKTGQWFARPTLRRLKWAISVYVNSTQELR
jgi:hypothetical protein